jgi:hypothetical protein
MRMVNVAVLVPALMALNAFMLPYVAIRRSPPERW